MSRIYACVDGLAGTVAVCDYAVWAAQRLQAPLEFLHVLDRQAEPNSVTDFSGAIGMDAQETLLEQLSALDEQRSKLAQEHGRQILLGARARAEQAGVTQVDVRQRHGGLVENLLDLEPEARLVVLGSHCDTAGYSTSKWHFDHRAERIVRSLRKPVLVVATQFQLPDSFVIAFDGSRVGKAMIQTVADSPLLKGLSCHVVCVADDHGVANDYLSWARSVLEPVGFGVTTEVRSGEPDEGILSHIQQTRAGLLVMGAYGHSRIRHLIMGSTTSTLLRTSPVPVLILH